MRVRGTEGPNHTSTVDTPMTHASDHFIEGSDGENVREMEEDEANSRMRNVGDSGVASTGSRHGRGPSTGKSLVQERWSKQRLEGVNIVLDEETFGEITGTPSQGIKHYEHKRWPQINGFSPSEVAALITESQDLVGNESAFRPSTSNLTLTFRILHHMLTYIIVRKGGHCDSISFLEISLMWGIATGNQINLPYIIRCHILHAHGGKNASLPYGMLLTKIFMYFNVPLLDEIDQERLLKANMYDASTLSRMGYMKTRDHGWISKRGQAPVVQKGGDQEGEDAQPSLHLGASSSTPHGYEVQELYARVDSLNLKFDTLQQQNERMLELQQQMNANIQGIHQFLSQHFPPKPPPN